MLKYTFLLLTVAFASIANTTSAQTSAGSSSEKYKLVWADEFNYEGMPDSSKWKFEKGFVRNNELQWYQPDNARCHNGILVIEARKESKPNPNYKAESTNWKTSRRTIEYTSSSINTRGLHSWKFGRMIMRGRIDTEAGLWPAFWTLGVNGQWPSNGEIDIMEFYRGKLLANIACGTTTAYKAKWYSTSKLLSTFNDPNWSKKFHTWRMDWDETAISLYVDDELLNSVPLKDLVNQDGQQVNPFMQPQYVLLNMALGGDNGGNVTATTFPKRFEIDYVRVYQ